MLIIELPKLPNDVFSYIDTIFSYMATGAGILANYAPLGYLLVLFGVILAIDAGIQIYHFVMWIIKKIPVLGIS